ncbi:ROK family protein [Alloscardovia theropitheci]|uniref:ROK family protein n=1 Tax=Alloscardovia theropitheci TaxID=2496842 RepID=A0A4R0QXE7_9BIFI|nr:ROK family protein [Alloscardovia theropitheci]TCD54101.1 ROK family protein [Alloscardovia theropitheci]
MGKTYVGIDVGTTKIDGVLVDARGNVYCSRSIPTRAGADCVIEDIVSVVRFLIARSQNSDIDLIGVGIPGQVDSRRGIIRDVVNLNITELELEKQLRSQLNLDIHVENDVNAAAMGATIVSESTVPEDQTIAFMNFGSGLSAGVIRNGRILHGSTGSLGEIGHIPVDPNRFLCACGQRGCLETVASGGAIARLWQTDNPATMQNLIYAAQCGEKDAREILTMVIHAMVDAIQITAQAYDPAKILIGGGLAKAGQPLRRLIVAELSRRATSSHFLTTLDIPSRLTLISPDVPVGAIGAGIAAILAK